MAQITAGTTVIEAMLIGFTSRSETGNIIHHVIGKTAPDVTFATATLPAGTLKLLCNSHADALALTAAHRATGPIALTDSTLPAIAMTYVPAGAIEMEMDETTQTAWIVTVEYQAIG